MTHDHRAGPAGSFFRLGLAALALCATGPVLAASTWDFGACSGNGANQQAANSGTFGNAWACAGSSGSGTVTATAFGGENATGSTGFQSAYLSPQGAGSGFGVASRYEGLNVSSPNHSMDNDPSGSTTPDMISLQFDRNVTLTDVTVGWSQNDADLSVLAFTGAGWTLVKNLGDADPANATGYAGSGNDIVYSGWNPGNVSSSWWLVSAYSTVWGGNALDSMTDYVKLLSVAGNVTPAASGVPEPQSLALVAAALVGLAVRRRRGLRRPA